MLNKATRYRKLKAPDKYVSHNDTSHSSLEAWRGDA